MKSEISTIKCVQDGLIQSSGPSRTTLQFLGWTVQRNPKYQRQSIFRMAWSRVLISWNNPELFALNCATESEISTTTFLPDGLIQSSRSPKTVMKVLDWTVQGDLKYQRQSVSRKTWSRAWDLLKQLWKSWIELYNEIGNINDKVSTRRLEPEFWTF